MTPRKDIEPGIYRIDRPGEAGAILPLILDSPHSGRDYPSDFATACAPETLRAAEDNAIDLLFAGAPDHGATLLSALFPRTYIDPNRAIDDVDPNIVKGTWPGARPTARSQAGIGLVRRLLRPGVRLYDRKLEPVEIHARIDNYYLPYHAALRGLLDSAHENFGAVWHLDCHAMPSHQPADIVLGDRDGTACAPDFMAFLQGELTGMGFRVACNAPYKGVEILKRYGSSAEGRHSIQIEINKRLYWDESTAAPGANFTAMKEQMTRLVAATAGFITNALAERLAAD